MSNCTGTLCDDCDKLEFEDWPKGVKVGICTAPDKPVIGLRRVVSWSQLGDTVRIQRPKWCTKGA